MSEPDEAPLEELRGLTRDLTDDIREVVRDLNRSGSQRDKNLAWRVAGALAQLNDAMDELTAPLEPPPEAEC